MNFSHTSHTVSIQDARPIKDSFSLDVCGFAFVNDAEHSNPTVLQALGQNDDDVVKRLYYPEIERLVKKELGAARVLVFDHTVRRRERELAGKNPDGREQPASTVRF